MQSKIESHIRAHYTKLQGLQFVRTFKLNDAHPEVYEYRATYDSGITGRLFVDPTRIDLPERNILEVKRRKAKTKEPESESESESSEEEEEEEEVVVPKKESRKQPRRHSDEEESPLKVIVIPKPVATPRDEAMRRTVARVLQGERFGSQIDNLAFAKLIAEWSVLEAADSEESKQAVELLQHLDRN